MGIVRNTQGRDRFGGDRLALGLELLKISSAKGGEIYMHLDMAILCTKYKQGRAELESGDCISGESEYRYCGRFMEAILTQEGVSWFVSGASSYQARALEQSLMFSSKTSPSRHTAHAEDKFSHCSLGRYIQST